MPTTAFRVLQHLQREANPPVLRELLAPFMGLESPKVSLHLAVVQEPYLGFILRGMKSVESRFSVQPVPPYRRVHAGDLILLKHPGGPVVGAFTVSSAWHYRLDPSTWDDLRSNFAAALCAQDGFWEARANARFATLMRVSDVLALPPFEVPKQDRRGWVILADRHRGDRLF